MEKIRIEASDAYDVYVGRDLIKDAGDMIAEITGQVSAVIVSDDNVHGLYGELLRKSMEKAGFGISEFVFPHGEHSKSIRTFGSLLEYMNDNRMTRKDIIVALGGGIVGDLSGFAASAYQRGIRFIQIPTTLLAAVDASVGGKTAVNLSKGKNQAGCFYQPSLVICDTLVQETLPDEEYRCGCAEVIKYAMIDSEDLFRRISAVKIQDQTEHVVSTCVKIKNIYVRDDEFDTGKRMMLNFGHTIGHAIEACSNYEIPHGAAVASGMGVMTEAAYARGICSRQTADELKNLLKKYDLPSDTDFQADELFDAAMLDKKTSGDEIRIVVPERIGSCRIEPIKKEEFLCWLRDGGAA